MNATLVVLLSFLYLVLLFLVAIYANKREKANRSIVNNPYVYALTITVYCTVWTFYGSIGKAAKEGLSFIPVYLGPTLLAPIWYMFIRRIILISKQFRVTSIADFISSRYGKNTFVGIVTSLLLLFAVIPYISIQLKAIGFSFDILTQAADVTSSFWDGSVFYKDKVNYFTILLAIFTILFGTRRLDPHERHEGLVAAIALESLVKLVAFVAAGIYIVYGLYDGFSDIFTKAIEDDATRHMITLGTGPIQETNWFWVMILSASAIIFLPRQFHIAVVENYNPSFTRKAAWLFPLYMFLLCIFVVPLAIAGRQLLPQTVESDTYILALPLAFENGWLAMLVYIGGFSAAASMIVVSVISVSIMVSNNILMPFLVKTRTAKIEGYAIPAERLLQTRRIIIVMILFLSYTFFHLVSKDFPLVSIGLISFAAILQLVPAILGGMYLPKSNKFGAITGISVGFVIWFFCLMYPTLAEAKLIDDRFLTEGYWNLSWLRPYALFGMEGMDSIANACFWSMFFNIGSFVIVSLTTKQDVMEMEQADVYLHIERYAGAVEKDLVRRQASVAKLKRVLVRFLGSEKTRHILLEFDGPITEDGLDSDRASTEFIRFVERNLTGAFGAASTRLILSAYVKQEDITLPQLNEMLTQTKEIIDHSKALELKTTELEQMAQELALLNEQLKHLDVLKAEFISTVTHELRTPLTAIRSFAQIMHQNPQLDQDQKRKFLHIILQECDRIIRLVNQVLDVEKMEAQTSQPEGKSNLHEQILTVIDQMTSLIEEKGIEFRYTSDEHIIDVPLHSDKLIQVLTNLVSNAIKFSDTDQGVVNIRTYQKEGRLYCEIYNNGSFIPDEFKSKAFEKFTQVREGHLAKPSGSGLGLFITKKIIENAGGEIDFFSSEADGTTFYFSFAK